MPATVMMAAGIPVKMLLSEAFCGRGAGRIIQCFANATVDRIGFANACCIWITWYGNGAGPLVATASAAATVSADAVRTYKAGRAFHVGLTAGTTGYSFHLFPAKDFPRAEFQRLQL